MMDPEALYQGEGPCVWGSYSTTVGTRAPSRSPASATGRSTSAARERTSHVSRLVPSLPQQRVDGAALVCHRTPVDAPPVMRMGSQATHRRWIFSTGSTLAAPQCAGSISLHYYKLRSMELSKAAGHGQRC